MLSAERHFFFGCLRPAIKHVPYFFGIVIPKQASSDLLASRVLPALKELQHIVNPTGERDAAPHPCIQQHELCIIGRARSAAVGCMRSAFDGQTPRNVEIDVVTSFLTYFGVDGRVRYSVF